MFTYDERIKGLPASREQVLSVHASLNAPHLAIPGKAAGPATAYILGLRAPQGFAVFVYLHLGETQDCAVYVPERRASSADDYQAQESDAQAFVESMGFMMDNLNFRGRPPEEQEELMRTLPVFLRDPRLAPRSGAARSEEKARSAAGALGRLLASF